MLLARSSKILLFHNSVLGTTHPLVLSLCEMKLQYLCAQICHPPKIRLQVVADNTVSMIEAEQTIGTVGPHLGLINYSTLRA